MFSYLGTLSETVVAPSDYEGSTSSSTSDEVDDVAMLDDSLDSLSDEPLQHIQQFHRGKPFGHFVIFLINGLVYF